MPGTWTSGLFDCFDPIGTCCLSCWCPCILYGKIQDKKHDPHADTSGCNGSCCGWYCLATCGLQCILQTGSRGDIRKRYNIEGSGVGDFFSSWCCSCCALIQEDKEIEAQKNVLGEQIGYMPQQGMAYPAPSQAQETMKQ